MKYLTILCCDPGTANFSSSIVRVLIEAPFRYKILKTGMVQNPIRDLTGNLQKQVAAFEREMKREVKQFDVDIIVAERFMNRGRNGNTGELVSFMCGILMKISGTHLELITAAQWKNAFNRVQDLKALYKESSLVAHRIDAACIGIYTAAMYLGTQPFEFLGTGYKKFKERLEATNVERMQNGPELKIANSTRNKRGGKKPDKPDAVSDSESGLGKKGGRKKARSGSKKH